MNHVDYILTINTGSLTRENKLLIKTLGPHQPQDFVLTIKDGKQNRSFIRIETHKKCFPTKHIETLVEKYPFLVKDALISELDVIYSNETFSHERVSSITQLHKTLTEADLTSTFEQVSTLVQIILTTPICLLYTSDAADD